MYRRGMLRVLDLIDEELKRESRAQARPMSEQSRATPSGLWGWREFRASNLAISGPGCTSKTARRARMVSVLHCPGRFREYRQEREGPGQRSMRGNCAGSAS